MRYAKQKNRSYRTSYWSGNRLHNHVPLQEVMAHVTAACRPDADPVFNELAHMAALRGLRHGYTGQEGVCFLQPTNHPRGYFNLLKWISANPNCTKRMIDRHYDRKLITTLDRLLAGGLVTSVRARDAETHYVVNHYTVTDLGKSYIRAAQRYVVVRN